MSLREKKKLETRERIRAAAAELFTRRGYAAATMRQIAQRAHVGLGTLFNYAEDKRDLVFLIFNEELNAITDVALAAPRPEQPLIEQLMAVFGVHYRWLGEKPALARILLQELTFYSSGKQAATFLGIRKRLIDGIEQLIERSKKEKKIKSSESAALIARHIFFVYSASLRWWIAAAHPDPQKGLADLRRLLRLQLDGLYR
ncbi:MAG: TetR/AcrR family transcriptional regulator [Betaproteobacteria bacterium]|nr:MAG: TetR/AcrR family transcriptional regulator [Betaproteobacteria bacterium]